MIGILRAYKRLIHVLWMTFAETTVLVIKQYFHPKEKRNLSNEYRLRWARKAIRILGIKITFEGSIPPDGVIIVSNHRSYIDPPIILAVTNCTMLSKSEVAHMPIIGAGAKAVDILFVDREKRSSRIESLEVIAEALSRNVSVCIFPEGTTNANPGLLPFKPGIYNLASKRNCPVVPLALRYKDPSDDWGDESMYTYYMRTFSKRFIEVHLKFGPVMHGENSKELKNLTFDWIQDNLLKIQGREGILVGQD